MRRSSRRSRVRLEPTLDLTPMVDVVFLLIIFFMVSTTFITFESGLPVDLPQAQSAQAQASDLPTVTITRDQEIFVSGVQVSEAQLSGAVQRALNSNPSSGVVVLRADQSVPHGMTVRVMDQIRQGGAQRIAIATGG
ncbi:MAG: biopolymer transporter ExbD [Trueperaceae bacterium]|nr:biopolymer transporter ExbD [Trueperaceae bacterium]